MSEFSDWTVGWLDGCYDRASALFVTLSERTIDWFSSQKCDDDEDNDDDGKHDRKNKSE